MFLPPFGKDMMRIYGGGLSIFETRSSRGGGNLKHIAAGPARRSKHFANAP
jgi:hypothetical protein